jgi:hypothetical protein
MPVIRRGGISGKVCDICKEWKILAEFDLDLRPGRFKGYRQSICRKCASLSKAKKK